MAGSNPEFSKEDLAQMLRRPETQALFNRLRQLDSDTLEQAVRQAMSGNTQLAQQTLSPLMQDPQVQSLTDQMRESYGGI